MANSASIITCRAAHDETVRPSNFCFSFCRSNLICSHGNHPFDEALEFAIKNGWLGEEAKEIVEDTRRQLIQNIDGMSNARRIVRVGPTGESMTQETIDAMHKILVDNLGGDSSQWDTAQKSAQLELAKPIIDIAKKLQKLGLFGFPDRVIDINTSELVDLTYQEAD